MSPNWSLYSLNSPTATFAVFVASVNCVKLSNTTPPTAAPKPVRPATTPATVLLTLLAFSENFSVASGAVLKDLETLSAAFKPLFSTPAMSFINAFVLVSMSKTKGANFTPVLTLILATSSH